MPLDAFSQTKTALLELGGYRVWSLMVTLFGDLALAEGSTIDGPVLSSIMAEMDVRPEAVRVALFRLRNDGWIDSEKYGRTGRHALTSTSRATTLQASARIYASPEASTANWTLAVTPDSSTAELMAHCGYILLTPRVYLGNAQAKAPASALVLSGKTAPDWLRAQLAPSLLENEYTALLPHLQTAERTVQAGTLTPLQTAVIRCLLVHNWRRIVLRHPALPQALLPDDWVGHRCHLLVNTLLNRFPRPLINDITPP